MQSGKNPHWNGELDWWKALNRNTKTLRKNFTCGMPAPTLWKAMRTKEQRTYLMRM